MGALPVGSPMRPVVAAFTEEGQAEAPRTSRNVGTGTQTRFSLGSQGLGEGTSLEKEVQNIIRGCFRSFIEWARAAREHHSHSLRINPLALTKSDDFVERSVSECFFSRGQFLDARKSPGDFGRLAKNVDFFFRERARRLTEFDHELRHSVFFHRFRAFSDRAEFQRLGRDFRFGGGAADFGEVLAVASRVGGQ